MKKINTEKKLTVIFLVIFITLIILGVVYAVKNGKDKQDKPQVNYDFVDECDNNEWELFYEAVCWVESRNNPSAFGKHNDCGVIQITPIYCKEANRILGYDCFTHEDAFCPIKSREMFDVVQGYHNPGKDILKGIRVQNKADFYRERVLKAFELLKEGKELI